MKRGRDKLLRAEGVTKILDKELLLVRNTKPTVQINCEPNTKRCPLRRFWVLTIYKNYYYLNTIIKINHHQADIIMF